MRLVIGSDHHGVPLKASLVDELRQAGHQVQDVGTDTSDSPVDYPDIAIEVAQHVSRGDADRGILICGSGIGMCITANKLPHVRAAACHDEHCAIMSRRHNDANVVCLSDDVIAADANRAIVRAWLETEFDGGRHQRRIEKIAQLERAIMAERLEE